MNIFLASDIHYECLGTRKAVPVPAAAEIVVLAGDISHMPGALEIAEATADKTGLPVIFVPGNHEYYGRDYEKMTELANNYEHENVHALINKTVVIENVRFLGTPLWTGFNAFGDQTENMNFAQNNINDFCVIKHGGKPLTAEIMLEWHERSRQFLMTELEKPFDGKTVVVTHFPPSYKLCHPRFYGKKLSNYFNANCDDLLAKYTPDVWLYGHTHSPVEKELSGVSIYCNQGGYPSEDGVGFDPERIIALQNTITKGFDSGDAGKLDMTGIQQESMARKGLIFYDSPFHVTYDKEAADKLAEAVDNEINSCRSVLCPATLNTFNMVSRAWGLTEEEISAFQIKDQSNDDSLLKVEKTASIYKMLHDILNDPANETAWVHTPNRAFDNKTALSVMIDEPGGLERVQKYLLAILQ